MCLFALTEPLEILFGCEITMICIVLSFIAEELIALLRCVSFSRFSSLKFFLSRIIEVLAFFDGGRKLKIAMLFG